MKLTLTIVLCCCLAVISHSEIVKKQEMAKCPPGEEPKPINAYYINKTLDLCLSYKTIGCYNHKTAFEEMGECEGNRPADGASCSGVGLPIYQTEKVIGALRGTTTGGSCWDGEMKCPEHYECAMGAFFGSCCVTEIEEKFRQAFNATCPDGNSAYTVWDTLNGYGRYYLGDSCQDLPCPDGYNCVQVNDILAKCCGPPPPTPEPTNSTAKPEKMTMESITTEETSEPEDQGETTDDPLRKTTLGKKLAHAPIAFNEDEINRNIVKATIGERWQLVRKPTALNPIAPERCVDEESYCVGWAEEGACTSNPGWMSVHCQQSCSCCGCTLSDVYNAQFHDECGDRKEKCREWAETGECHRNRGLEAYCRKSCKLC